jgi:hypothetical protein
LKYISYFLTAHSEPIVYVSPTPDAPKHNNMVPFPYMAFWFQQCTQPGAMICLDLGMAWVLDLLKNQTQSVRFMDCHRNVGLLLSTTPCSEQKKDPKQVNRA